MKKETKLNTLAAELFSTEFGQMPRFPLCKQGQEWGQPIVKQGPGILFFSCSKMAMKLPGFHRIVMQMYGLMSWFEYDSPPKAQVLKAWFTEGSVVLGTGAWPEEVDVGWEHVPCKGCPVPSPWRSFSACGHHWGEEVLLINVPTAVVFHPVTLRANVPTAAVSCPITLRANAPTAAVSCPVTLRANVLTVVVFCPITLKPSNCGVKNCLESRAE